VIAVTGLSDLFGSFVERIEKDATKRVNVYAVQARRLALVGLPFR
jgi:hypothetical protein